MAKRKINPIVKEERMAWQVLLNRIKFLEQVTQLMDQKTIEMTVLKMKEDIKEQIRLYEIRTNN